MPWYGWLALALALALVASVAGLALLRSSARGRRFWALSPRAKLRFGRALLRDPGTPRAAKIALLALVGYLVLPFDLVPDFLPLIGQLDDVLAIALVAGLVIALLPAERIERALEAAEADARPPPV